MIGSKDVSVYGHMDERITHVRLTIWLKLVYKHPILPSNVLTVAKLVR